MTRPRPSRKAALTTAIALLIAGVTAGLLRLAVSPSTSEPTSTDGNATGPTEPADPEDVAHALAHVEWEVLAVGISPVSSVVGHVAIDQGRVDELWRAFEMEGSAPTLPSGQAALVLPVAGSCDDPAQVAGIEGIVNRGRTGAYAAVQLEAGCAELPGRGTFWPPPHALYVIAVPVDVAERLAGVVAVVGRVADFDWEVLAVARIRLIGAGFVVWDQRGLDLTWGPRYHLQGPAPALAAGQGALVLEVPGSCDNAAQVQAVDAVATDENPDEPHVVGAVYFDPACAVPLHDPPVGQPPATLYLIAIPIQVAQSMGGAVEFIACAGLHIADGAGCADPWDNAVEVYDLPVHDLPVNDR